MMRTAVAGLRIGHGFATWLTVGIVSTWVLIMALSLRHATLPPEASGVVTAAFPTGISEADILASILRAGGEPIGPTWLGFVWLARNLDQGFVGRLQQEGAIAVFERLDLTPVLASCSGRVFTQSNP